MNVAPDDFEQLRRILALKRHERPPPGFFHEFPDKVMLRLRLARHSQALPWWRRFSLEFELKPAAAFGASVLLCGLLLGGLAVASQIKPSAQAASSGQSDLGTALASPDAVLLASTAETAPAAPPDDVLSSTEPVIAELPAASPFDKFDLRVQRASVTFGFGGR